MYIFLYLFFFLLPLPSKAFYTQKNQLNPIPISHCLARWCYGIDIPNGLSAVKYIYGPEGTWKHIDRLHYGYNYYKACADAHRHPYNRLELIQEANGSKAYTAGDGNCHLLFHTTSNEIQYNVNAYAFEEHNGRGADGKTLGNPFSNFWYDDNWLARYMSTAYSKPMPAGLTYYAGFIRWKIIGGDIEKWIVYHNDEKAVDLLALNGLYYLLINEPFNAFLKFNTIISLSGSKYNNTTKQYDFSNMHDVYYYGLALILVTKLIDYAKLPQNVHNALIPYALSLRSHLLLLQQKKNGYLISWLSGDDPDNLINTETTASSVLGLSTDSLYTFEIGAMEVPGSKTIINNKNNSIIATPKKTKVGTIAETTPVMFLLNHSHEYRAIFYLRGTKPDVVGAVIGTLNVIGPNAQILLSKNMYLRSEDGRTWTREVISIPVYKNEKLSFSIKWTGHNTLETSFIRII